MHPHPPPSADSHYRCPLSLTLCFSCSARASICFAVFFSFSMPASRHIALFQSLSFHSVFNLKREVQSQHHTAIRPQLWPALHTVPVPLTTLAQRRSGTVNFFLPVSLKGTVTTTNTPSSPGDLRETSVCSLDSQSDLWPDTGMIQPSEACATSALPPTFVETVL